MWDFQPGDGAKKKKKKKVGRDGALLRNVLTVLLEMDAAGRIPADVS